MVAVSSKGWWPVWGTLEVEERRRWGCVGAVRTGRRGGLLFIGPDTARWEVGVASICQWVRFEHIHYRRGGDEAQLVRKRSRTGSGGSCSCARWGRPEGTTQLWWLAVGGGGCCLPRLEEEDYHGKMGHVWACLLLWKFWRGHCLDWVGKKGIRAKNEIRIVKLGYKFWATEIEVWINEFEFKPRNIFKLSNQTNQAFGYFQKYNISDLEPWNFKFKPWRF
jgi:hypothetical protein